MPKTYTVKDVANILGFSTNSIYTFLKEKRIKGVRVGKGRFRIPEEELSRILHLSKNPAALAQQSAQPGITSPKAPVVADPLLNADASPVIVRMKPTDVLEVDIFDWFIGMSAVVSGVALFLFNASTNIQTLSYLVPITRLVLICAGLGIVGSSIQGKSKQWHIFFQSILVAAWSMRTYELARGFDVAGVVIYASLVLVIVLRLLRETAPEISMGRFITSIGFGSVMSMAIWPQQPLVRSAGAFLNVPMIAILCILLGLQIVVTCMYWIGYVRRIPWVFAVSCVIFGIVCVLTATFYGEFLYWSRAFFYIVFAFFCLFLPISQMILPSKSPRERLYLHLFFGGIGGLLLLAISAVFSLHQVLWHQRVNDFANKIAVGQTIFTNAISDVKSSITTASSNADFLTGVEKNESDTLVRNAKIVYEGNPMIRRLVFLNAKGDGVAIYPYGVFDRTNYAFREYFIRVRESKAIYVSNVFETNADGVHRPVVSVSMPLLDKKGVFAGAMNASVNLDKIALQLQQVALESGGEFFTVVDEHGTYVSHPVLALIGKDAPANDPVRKGIEKKHGIEQLVMPDGSLGLVAYDSISSLGWGISIQVPSTAILALSPYSLVLTFATMFIVFSISIWLLYVMKFRWGPQQRGSP